jgi:hypothetical protein
LAAAEDGVIIVEFSWGDINLLSSGRSLRTGSLMLCGFVGIAGGQKAASQSQEGK